MRRRDLLSILGGVAVSWPVGARGQRPKVPRVGVLLFSTPQADPQINAINTRLRELGYVEGQNLLVIYRYAEGKYERLPELAADLVRQNPDLLLALGGDVAPHAVKATAKIPIVFVSSADPVQLGLAASLARPGGNATASRSCWTIPPQSGWSSSRRQHHECGVLRSSGTLIILIMS